MEDQSEIPLRVRLSSPYTWLKHLLPLFCVAIALGFLTSQVGYWASSGVFVLFMACAIYFYIWNLNLLEGYYEDGYFIFSGGLRKKDSTLISYSSAMDNFQSPILTLNFIQEEGKPMGRKKFTVVRVMPTLFDAKDFTSVESLVSRVISKNRFNQAKSL